MTNQIDIHINPAGFVDIRCSNLNVVGLDRLAKLVPALREVSRINRGGADQDVNAVAEALKRARNA